ncbi:MAG: glycosyltransferase [Sandaracinaceae bacterium]|nr:glycosyltransferase [Sandaracinaceae bacterium]
MRVAYLVNQYPKVSHTFIRREIRALERAGVEVLRYSLRRVSEPLTDAADREGARAHARRARRGHGGTGRGPHARERAAPGRLRARVRAGRAHRLPPERGLPVHAAYLAEACVLARWLAQSRADHVHAHFGTNSAAVAMLTAALGGPGYSFTVHGPEELDKPQAIALREKIARARFVCAISSFCRSQLYRWSPPSCWSKIALVRCGVDLDFLGPADRPLPRAPALVSVGRLDAQKGQLLLLEALAALAAEGRDFSLTLVGDGELRGDVERAIDRLGLRARVTITGWASGDEVREHILGARALVLPSFAEGLPVVLMEALGLGRPVLSTYVAGIPELVEPGRSGWLVPAGSADALASALREVLAAPDAQLAAMGEAGRRAVLERHDVRTTAGALRGLLERHAA